MRVCRPPAKLLTFAVDDQIKCVEISKSQILLEAAKAAGLTPRFSYQPGVCGSYKAKLTKSDVHLRVCMALEDKSAILTC